VTEIITRYFPDLTEIQADRFSRLLGIYRNWNSRINVISRKDMDDFYVHHVLHSLSIAKTFRFSEGSKVLDVGTGGGFPGIPLAIFFPAARFYLLDSIGKKIKVVTEVSSELELRNVIPLLKRAEDENGKYDFVVSRAVTNFSDLVRMTSKNIGKENRNFSENGIICLKGGDIRDELGRYFNRVKIWNISEFFSEPFFETKKIVYLRF
jgi:16S rRNA (guanine527-N7)-methyltransferase